MCSRLKTEVVFIFFTENIFIEILQNFRSPKYDCLDNCENENRQASLILNTSSVFKAFQQNAVSLHAGTDLHKSFRSQKLHFKCAILTTFLFSVLNNNEVSLFFDPRM